MSINTKVTIQEENREVSSIEQHAMIDELIDPIDQPIRS